MRFQDGIHVRPSGLDGLRVMYYRRVTKGCVCRGVAMNWMHRVIRNDDSILVLNKIYIFIVIITEAYSYWADLFFLLCNGNCVHRTS